MKRIQALRDRMERSAERMAVFQAKLFLNMFYVLIVPLAHLWLRFTGRLHHRTTGFFQEATNKSNELAAHLKQH